MTTRARHGAAICSSLGLTACISLGLTACGGAVQRRPAEPVEATEAEADAEAAPAGASEEAMAIDEMAAPPPAGAPAPAPAAPMAEPQISDFQRADEQMIRLNEMVAHSEHFERRLAAELARTQGPDCDTASGLRDRICDLSTRICDIAQRHPDDAEVRTRCQDASERCERARTDVEAACGG